MRFSQRFLKYIFIVILPLIILTIIYWVYFDHSIQKERQSHAERIGFVYQKYIDQVISETKENVGLLSLGANRPYMDDRTKNQMLHSIKNTDSRYADIYLLNEEGIAIHSTSEQDTPSKLINQEDMDLAINTHKPVVVSIPELDDLNCDCFTVFSSLLDNSEKVQGFLMVHIELDYLENIMKTLIPDETVKLQAGNGNRLLDINIGEVTPNSRWVSFPLSEVDWSLSVKMPEKVYSDHVNTFYSFIVFTFIITNVIYFIVYELLFRKESMKEKKLFDNQKLNFVGTLAASTAHEIKNPLTGIKGLVQLLNEKHQDEQDQFYYSVIMKEIERINSIVSEFLVLGKPMVQQLSPYDVRGIVAELRPIIESEAHYYKIELEWDIARSPLPVYCTKDQLKQVILNIAKNGFEAMEQGQKLNIHIYQKKQEAIIEITDSGHGLEANEILKVFEPFYTSKQEGTGLGLFVCKRIIELFKGTIEVTSKPLEGTTFTISLPTLKGDCIQ
ncbi:ATP-binding protein [Peribacillus sp. NPDC097675]|uniref:ATP-binding protein n=1 Tax=Peribacillus sp. NPDC097675 TaxID=3390618 RepID=UPI003CFE5761